VGGGTYWEMDTALNPSLYPVALQPEKTANREPHISERERTKGEVKGEIRLIASDLTERVTSRGKWGEPKKGGRGGDLERKIE